MQPNLKYLVLLFAIAACNSSKNLTKQTAGFYNEPHRPQVHFSPKANWMNDPNGMVYLNNQYHLFFQYYPDSTVWGPMHWGHATSTDLVQWQEQPIALYPDSLGYIFSGSAVVDVNNTTGFGTNGKPPLVAIFTHHDMKGEKAGTSVFQNQSIAYSLDEGKSWTKYADNPVVRNPGVRDFRDPKVMWHEAGKKWVMTLATKDRITFYSSPDLKTWAKESEFGESIGAHGGVWECPDLFSLNHEGKTIWVLLVSINPGGPNKGSGTQYFTGDFDGKTFTPFQTDTRWIDYGTDNYAGVTWANTGERKIFLGWMSNWQYATIVPTKVWRSAMTVPRDLSLQKIGEKYMLASLPVPELNATGAGSITLDNINAKDFDLSKNTNALNGPARLQLNGNRLESFSITLSNAGGEKVVVGYNKTDNTYFIDRSASGKIDFEKGFAVMQTAPRFSVKDSLDMTLIIDDASVEVFTDGGLTVMTAIFFPNEKYAGIQLQSPGDFIVGKVQFTVLKSIWRR